ncbi:MAG: RES family NAD+ phosphorylase [Legionellales bacterium]|nr:RES family NAD+ phosphorylase [Legionellales bacterium]
MKINDLPTITLKKEKCFRLIPSKYPPIHLFEDVATNDEFEAIFKVQSLTNPRIQDEIGYIHLIPNDERLFGVPDCSYIMAAFTHINPNGSRFSNGDYGIYYAAQTVETALAETIYHREKFFRHTKEPAQEMDMRCLTAIFNADLINLATEVYRSMEIYHPENYHYAQQIGKQVKSNKLPGIKYYSVRLQSGINYALFTPKLFTECYQTQHYTYVWDGARISSYYLKSNLQSLIELT